MVIDGADSALAKRLPTHDSSSGALYNNKSALAKSKKRKGKAMAVKEGQCQQV